MGCHQRTNVFFPTQEWDNTVLVVSGREVTIREMEVGHWYVFRVAAVDARGSAGFLESPVPFRLQTEPIAPSPPTNLTVIQTSVCLEKKSSHLINF